MSMPTLRANFDSALQLFLVSLLALLVSFALLIEEHQRNWLLYLTALLGFGFLTQRQVRSQLRSNRTSLALGILLLLPLLSILWSTPGAAAEPVELKDLILAAICIAGVYLGLTALNLRQPAFSGRLQLVFAATALFGLWLALGHWWFWLRPTAERPRFEGGFAFYNAVHASIFAFAAGLLAIHDRLNSRQPVTLWLSVPLLVSVSLFGLLAGARAAMAAFVITALAMLVRKGAGRWGVLAGGALLTAAVGATLLLIGPEQLKNIWLSRGLSYRLEIWDQVLTQFGACPFLLGCGIDAPPSIVAGLETGDRAHSMPLATFYYYGVLGLLITAAALGYLALRGAEKGGTAWAWLLGYALLANMTSGDHVLERATLFWPYFWLPVLMLATINRASPGTPARAQP
ncbi:MAG: hypothetical protein AAGG11_10665 [Pseudomonadota bacterium]